MDNNNNNNAVQGFYNYSLKSEPEPAAPPVPPVESPRPAQPKSEPPKPAPPRPEPPKPVPPVPEQPGKEGDAPKPPAPAKPNAPQKPPAAPAAPAPSGKPQRPEKERGFKVNFDFDREYEDVPKETLVHVKRTRRTGCFGSVLFSVFIICVSVILAALMWLATTDILGFGTDDGAVQVTVPEDFTVEDIAELLYKADLVKYKSLFLFYSNFSNIEEKILPGTYELDRGFDYRALVYGMSKTGSRVTVDVLFPEGYTLLQIFNTLEENKVCTAEKMWEAAAETDFDYEFLKGISLGDSHRLEGFLFPDTYTFYIGDTPTRVLTIMLNNFNNRFKEEYYEKAELLGYSVRDIVIIASMIEREASTDEDRPLVASVIYNRLSSDEYPRLEIDATIRYVIAETGEAFSTSLNSPYNTYKNNGLPPGAISNPGLKSIQAALDPDETPFYFYALKHDGSHKFSETFDEHVAFVNSDEYGG